MMRSLYEPSVHLSARVFSFLFGVRRNGWIVKEEGNGQQEWLTLALQAYLSGLAARSWTALGAGDSNGHGGSFLLRASLQDDSRLAFWAIGFPIAHVRGRCSVLTWLAKVAENSAGWRTCRVSITYLLA